MWKSDLYPTEVHKPLVARRYGLPVYTAPIAGEALLSWLCRMGAMVEESPLTFARHAFGIDSVRRTEWWRRPTAEQRGKLLAVSGLAPDQLDDMTLERWSIARHDESDRRFSPIRLLYPKLQPGRSLSACGACLTEDETPYLRREWLIGWQAICPRHRTVLMLRCPSCHWKLSSLWLRDKASVDLRHCKRCGGMLAKASSTPAIGIAIDLQEAMLDVKRRGCGAIPGLDIIRWEMFTVIVDLVLRAVWGKSDRVAREMLLAELFCDLSLPPNEQDSIDWKGNYGTLVLLAWMLRDWPVRLRRSLELLDAPRVENLLGQIQAIDNRSEIRARTQLQDVLDYQPRSRRWRPWLRGLVKAGADFHALARAENVWQRKERFTALALLGDGKSIAQVALAVRVSTNMIKRWLEIGTAFGLEAMLEKPLRICDLTSIQIEEILTWLAATERTSGCPLAWKRERARSEISTRFGLLITTNTAYQLLLKHRQRH